MKAATIRPARPDEAEVLTALAIRSKAHWGYDDTFMAACVDELTMTPGRVRTANLLVAEVEGALKGMAGLERDGDGWEVCMMFIDPAAIGTGLGKLLFLALMDQARDMGIDALNIDADPNAESFYLRMGAVTVGRVASGSIPGRMIPQLLLRL